MTPGQRKAEANHLLNVAVAFQGTNELTISGELLWGALNHLGTAIADHHGLTRNGRPLTQRQKPKEAMRQMQATSPETPSLVLQFDNIAALHGNFYNGQMGREELSKAVEAGIQFIYSLYNRPEVQGLP